MHTRSGFTLIELSIVLVIIGLIAGGVLVGRDLIEAARIRQQITEIEQFKTAVNTFRIKYNGLPGDLNYTDAAALGFTQASPAMGMETAYWNIATEPFLQHRIWDAKMCCSGATLAMPA
jgi:prepilin-type N-terminal cleavage/methylation domain-containing protein